MSGGAMEDGATIGLTELQQDAFTELSISG